MRLYLHIANKKQLEHIWNDLFNIKDYEEIKKKLKILEYDNHQISFQYKTLYEAVRVLKQDNLFWATIASNVYGFYFWNDTCEHLIPTLKEYKDFENYVNKELNTWKNSARKKTISFVTPDVWDYGIKKLKIIFDYLETKKYKTEVIVNDFWVINLLKNYKQLIPVLGRMLNKAQRNPIIDKNPDPQVPSFLGREIYEKIKKYQYAYYNSNPLTIDIYKDSFKNLWINRFWVDNLIIEEKEIDENLDVYYPYNTVAHGRNCATRWIQEKTWEYYVQDKPCPRYCQKYDIFIGQWTHERWITQRWNWVFKKYLNLDKIKLKKEDRIIFSPFIPV